jgi:hypothetical protein
VDAILDQWDLQLGADVTLFMEKGIRESERVLLVCTPTYCRKANEGEGGVGYERLVVTGEIAEKIDTTKFIFIIKEDRAEDAVPGFAKTRLWIDFRNDEEYEERVEELLRALLDAPAEPKPPLGPNPFLVEGEGLAITGSRLPAREDVATTDDVERLYARAESILRDKDLLGWKQLLRNTQKKFKPALIEWRARVEPERPTQEEWVATFDEAVEVAAPLMLLALTAVDSQIPEVANQVGLMDFFTEIEDWNGSGRIVLVHAPEGLVYVYHHVLGALFLESQRIEPVVDLLSTQVGVGHGREAVPLWQARKLIGWPEALGGHAYAAWDFLGKSLARHDWLKHFFIDDSSFLRSLRAYNLVASLLVLADQLRQGVKIDGDELPLAVRIPPMFLPGNNLERVIRHAFPNGDALRRVADVSGVSTDEVRAAWPKWLNLCARSLGDRYDFWFEFSGEVPPLPST